MGRNPLIRYANNGKRERALGSKGAAASALLGKTPQLLRTQSWQIADAGGEEPGLVQSPLSKDISSKFFPPLGNNFVEYLSALGFVYSATCKLCSSCEFYRVSNPLVEGEVVFSFFFKPYKHFI